MIPSSSVKLYYVEYPGFFSSKDCLYIYDTVNVHLRYDLEIKAFSIQVKVVFNKMKKRKKEKLKQITFHLNTCRF